MSCGYPMIVCICQNSKNKWLCANGYALIPTKKYKFAVCKLYPKFLNERKSIAFIYTEDTVNEKPHVK